MQDVCQNYTNDDKMTDDPGYTTVSHHGSFENESRNESKSGAD